MRPRQNRAAGDARPPGMRWMAPEGGRARGLSLHPPSSRNWRLASLGYDCCSVTVPRGGPLPVRPPCASTSARAPHGPRVRFAGVAADHARPMRAGHDGERERQRRRPVRSRESGPADLRGIGGSTEPNAGCSFFRTGAAFIGRRLDECAATLGRTYKIEVRWLGGASAFRARRRDVAVHLIDQFVSTSTR